MSIRNSERSGRLRLTTSMPVLHQQALRFPRRSRGPTSLNRARASLASTSTATATPRWSDSIRGVLSPEAPAFFRGSHEHGRVRTQDDSSSVTKPSTQTDQRHPEPSDGYAHFHSDSRWIAARLAKRRSVRTGSRLRLTRRASRGLRRPGSSRGQKKWADGIDPSRIPGNSRTPRTVSMVHKRTTH